MSFMPWKDVKWLSLLNNGAYSQEYVKPFQGETILDEANRLTSSDRHSAYGHPLDDFGKVVGMAQALWGRGPETEEEHAIYMILVKLSREANQPKHDNRVDIAGYIKTLDMVIEERARRERAGS